MDGSTITRRREAVGLTGRGLARLLGVAPSTLLRWERGDVAAPPAMAKLVDLTLRPLEKNAARRAAYRAARRPTPNSETLQ